MIKFLIKYFLCFQIAFLIHQSSVSAQVIEEDSVSVEEEGEPEEGEIDAGFTGYTDLHYWDYMRIPGFKFDTTMIPSTNYYPFGWDTITINPYQEDLKEMPDTFLLHLKDSGDCMFHPPAIGELSSGFGFRQWGRRRKFHFGVDVKMERGDPVYAIFDGVVRVAKKSTDYGYVVLIRHYNGLETLYAHFFQLLTYPGAPVRSGDIIGLAGSTGHSTGPHLHFEVRFKGEKIDPNKIIYFPSGSLLDDNLQVDKSCFRHLYDVQKEKLKRNRSGRFYKVHKGDSIESIAYEYGISVKHLSRINGFSAKTKLKAGRRIRVR
ncbi:MAG: peptidoglycan DD-metalloendopeptidase family protein [Bacteroidia bacterium]